MAPAIVAASTPAPPEGVEAIGPTDRAAGVLRDPQAIGAGIVHALEQHRGRPTARSADSAAALTAGVTGRPSAPSGPWPGQLMEEDVARILAHQRRPGVGIGVDPVADRLHRDRRRNQAAIAQEPADRDIGAPVLRRKADPHDAAVGQPQPSRALDLEEEEVDRIGPPRRFRARARRARPPRSPRGRNKGRRRHFRREAPLAALAGLGIGVEQVGRARIDWDLEARLAGARAGDFGLVIAGGESSAVADRDRDELFREEKRPDRRSSRARRRRPGAQSSGAVSPLASARRVSDGQLVTKASSARRAASGAIDEAGDRRSLMHSGLARGLRRRRRHRRFMRTGNDARAAAERDQQPGHEEKAAKMRFGAGHAPNLGGFVGLDEQPVGVLARQVALEGPDFPWSVPRRRASRRPSRRPLSAGNRGDEGIEAHLDLGDLARRAARCRSRRARSRPGDCRGTWPALSRSAIAASNASRTSGPGEPGEQLAVGRRAERLEDHPVGALRAFEETGDVEARIGADDRADAGGGAFLIGIAARFGRRGRDIGSGGGRRGGPRRGEVTGCCSCRCAGRAPHRAAAPRRGRWRQAGQSRSSTGHSGQQ